jgi:hypothetical protein
VIEVLKGMRVDWKEGSFVDLVVEQKWGQWSSMGPEYKLDPAGKSRAARGASSLDS